MKTKWWVAVLWGDQRAVSGGFYPSPHYLCHSYCYNIYNKHLKWNRKAHTTTECSGLLSEEPSENYIFVFKVGPVTRLSRKWRSLKHRLCWEMMSPSKHIPADNTRPLEKVTLGSVVELSHSEYTIHIWLDGSELVPSRQAWPCHSVSKPQQLIRDPKRICKENINPSLSPWSATLISLVLGGVWIYQCLFKHGPLPPAHTTKWFE